MKARVESLGWTKAPTEVEWQHPNGYYNYMLYPVNGMIRHYAEWADSNSLIPDGEYDLPDSLFTVEVFDNDNEVIYE